MERRTHEGLAYYQSTVLAGVKHGFFTRRGGASAAPFASLNLGGNVGDDPNAVRENHVRMYAALGVEDARACSVWQVHSVDTVLVKRPVHGRRWIAAADGMITDQPDTPLSMRFADCTPILLHDPVKGVIGAAHAGWRGTVKGMAARIVGAMQQAYGCDPRDMIAVIGPAIGPNRYQVGAEVVEAVRGYFGNLTGLIRRDPIDGTAYFDLWEANRRDLQRAGVEQIDTAGLCTAEHTDEFFSHRAEHGRTGRFGAVICMS
ncbi:MAG: peptidoglycan editing factor PgeF [bacterium]|nr:peptidoglycan editing factor PgeF [bacterium]